MLRGCGVATTVLRTLGASSVCNENQSEPVVLVNFFPSNILVVLDVNGRGIQSLVVGCRRFAECVCQFVRGEVWSWLQNVSEVP